MVQVVANPYKCERSYMLFSMYCKLSNPGVLVYETNSIILSSKYYGNAVELGIGYCRSGNFHCYIFDLAD